MTDFLVHDLCIIGFLHQCNIFYWNFTAPMELARNVAQRGLTKKHHMGRVSSVMPGRERPANNASQGFPGAVTADTVFLFSIFSLNTVIGRLRGDDMIGDIIMQATRSTSIKVIINFQSDRVRQQPN